MGLLGQFGSGFFSGIMLLVTIGIIFIALKSGNFKTALYLVAAVIVYRIATR